MDKSQMNLEDLKVLAAERCLSEADAERLVALMSEPKFEFRTTEEGCVAKLKSPGIDLGVDFKAPLDDKMLSLGITHLIREYIRRRERPDG